MDHLPIPSASDRVAREDLLLFVNACFACTGQREFYGDGHGQSISLDFLHRYVAGNYRDLYAQVLALGVNHANQAMIVRNLLATGRDVRAESRARENALVTRALHTLPTHRAMHLLEDLAKRGVNNRRTRALTKAYLERPAARDFVAVKYRRSFRRAAVHAHLPFTGELGPFLLRGWKERRFTTPLFETFRQAHFADSALYGRLPRADRPAAHRARAHAPRRDAGGGGARGRRRLVAPAARADRELPSLAVAGRSRGA
jgi:hypothetical protein